MRSRFSAYASGLVAYIIDTTDPENPEYKGDRSSWTLDIEGFCQGTEFLGLEVGHSVVHGDEGRVQFQVELTQDGEDAGFKEDSRFEARIFGLQRGQPLCSSGWSLALLLRRKELESEPAQTFRGARKSGDSARLHRSRVQRIRG